MHPALAMAMDFYRRNYRAPFSRLLRDEDTNKVVLEDGKPRRCRFCGGDSSTVSFRLEAHAIPESIGNRTLISRNECDACNRFFGSTIENDFGHWSKPMRTLGGRSGKKGIPTHKGRGENSWRIERCENQFSINIGEDQSDLPFIASEDHRTIEFKLKSDPHVPIAVLKAFVKMGLSVLPQDELPNFEAARAWVHNPHHQEDVPILAPVLVTFMPERLDGIKIGVLCRRPDAPDRVPYAFLILAYGHEAFQVILPSPEQDQCLAGTEAITLQPFPTSGASGAPGRVFEVDLTDTEVVRDARGYCRFDFGSVETHGPEAV